MVKEEKYVREFGEMRDELGEEVFFCWCLGVFCLGKKNPVFHECL